MSQKYLFEAISFMVEEEIERILSEDEALRISDKRRKEFLKTASSNSPSDNSKEKISEEGILPDKPANNNKAPPPGNKAPVDASPDMGQPMDVGGVPAAAGQTAAGQTTDTGDALEAGGGATAVPTGTPPGEEMQPGEETPGDDLEGDSMDAGEDGEDGGLEKEPTGPPFKGATTTDEKLQVILDKAEKIAEETQDPQKVLKTVKSLIQAGFSNPKDARKIIVDLLKTNDPILQQVSKRLYLFIENI